MKRLALCLAVAWVLLASVAPPRVRADGSPDLSEYKRAVHQVRISLERAALEPAAGRRNIAQSQRSLLRLGSVRLPDGRTLPTSTPQLALDLASGDPGALRRVLQQIRALDNALTSLSVRAADPRQLRVLDTVLRDRRFSTGKGMWELLQDWARKLLERILAGVADAGGMGAVTAGAVGLACLALIAAIAFFAAQGALENIVVDIPASDVPEPTRANVAGIRAAERADVGDHRTALRYLFLATLLSLQEHGILELQPGLTNGEYLRRVTTGARESDALSDSALWALQQLTDAFDRAWYGHAPVDAAAYARYRELANHVLDALGSSVAA